MEKEKSNFDAIFGFIKNMGVKEEFKEKIKEEEQKITNVLKYSEPQTSLQQPIINNSDSTEMTNKLIEYIRTINEDGIDFFEVWESTQIMGGTKENLKQAFTILKVASGNQLTVDKVISSATRYKTKLNELVSGNIYEKKKTRDSLLENQSNEKISLEKNIEELTKNIEKLNLELSTKKSVLQNIDSKYTPEINSINKQISIAETCLNAIIEKINNTIENIKTI